MQQSSDDTSSGHSNVQSNISKELGSGAWGVMSTSDVYHASNDATLFSTSLPVLLHENYHGRQSVDDTSSSLDKSNPDREDNELLEDVANQVIGSLLPDDEDDLLAGIMDVVGMGLLIMVFQMVWELLPENILMGSILPEPCLFGNINSNVEDSELRTLFEQYGDIRTLYTACKHRGFVMISYYDIRAARTAMRALQNKPLRRRKIGHPLLNSKGSKNCLLHDNPSDKDINQGTLVVFNLDPSVSNDDLRQIFGAYGEVKEIRETPHKRHHKFIEFYDVRAAEAAALRSLNRSDIAGKRIKLEPSRPGEHGESAYADFNTYL
ncbi:MEI2-like protein 5 [Actinidia rufa]|uniref:MEI2-like protein 5 n=1 Tax=Actinidia rufa TaxID=165716 RepID=A0A7J0G5X1_9ERIC|nr:MEI2-like protein 5 [Actinidia rufa]